MPLELGVVSRNAEMHKKKYEFFSDLEKLMEEKPEFVQQLQEYLAAKAGPRTVAPQLATNNIKKIDMIVKILQENRDWMSPIQITEAAKKMGFAVASKNPRHAFSSALSAEKKRANSRIAHRNRKWGLAEWLLHANENRNANVGRI